ncbi:transferase [Pseudonocardia sp. D17]|nr:transferase [Pseudonocardia sp. D17]
MASGAPARPDRPVPTVTPEEPPGDAPDGHRPPLAGVRVIELGNFVAAPSAARLLGEFGAEIIKIEQPGVGDEVRRWRLGRGETSMMWRTLARNKKSVTLDLRRPEGQDLVRRLAATADVVLENYRPGTLEKWGIAPDVLRRDNPSLVVVRISGYGQTGPYRDRPGFGGVAEALGGLRHLTGHPDRPPTRVGVSLGDQLAGLHAVIGALLGLRARERRPAEEGETVDVALYEAVYSIMEGLVPEYSAYGLVRERSGNAIPGVAPSNTYPCRDGDWVVIGANSDTLFRRLMIAIGRDDLATDARLRGNAGRAAHATMLDDAIAAFTVTRRLDEMSAILDAAQVPGGPIYSAADIVADPHFRARDMLVPLDVVVEDEVETVPFPGVVPKLARRPGAIRWLGPELGEHTDEVLVELLGLAPEEIAQLRGDGVV